MCGDLPGSRTELGELSRAAAAGSLLAQTMLTLCACVCARVCYSGLNEANLAFADSWPPILGQWLLSRWLLLLCMDTEQQQRGRI